MSYIPDSIRQAVAVRAAGCCEYCLVSQEDSFYSHEIDHIIPEKHRGETLLENLCLACIECNRHKGSDFVSIDPQTGAIVRLFDPRVQHCMDHFQLDGPMITPLSPEGRVTEFILKLNDEMRLRVRAALINAGRYPPQKQT